MRRRELLAALGASASLVAGCSGLASQGRTTPEPSPQPSDRATSRGSSGRRSVTLADTASVPADADLSVEATVERGQVDAADTARVTVELTNTGEARATRIFDGAHCHVFNRSYGGSTPAGLWLHRASDAPEDPDDGRWRRDAAPGEPRTFVAIGCGRAVFESAASAATTYELWDDYATEGYLRPGTYRFERTVRLWPSRGAEEPTRDVDWWLELDVEYPPEL